MKTVAIMQPTYLPWVGYFDLMDQSDVFVFLDSVQFSRRSWQQRNRIKTQQGELMLTIPVLTKGKREQLLNETQIDKDSDFASVHLKSIQRAYAKAPYFNQYFPSLSDLMQDYSCSLSDYHIRIISFIQKALGISCSTVKSSELPVKGKREELLFDICRHLGAECYLSAAGSRDYLDTSSIFQDHGIAIRYHQYIPAAYGQLHGDFIPYMSILDLLLNQGPQSLDIIRQGRAPRTDLNPASPS